MGKNSRNKQLAELEAKYRGRVDPDIIKMIFEECGYKLSEADGQLQALAPPPDPTEVAQFPPMQPSKPVVEPKKDAAKEEVDKFNPVDADPIFAQLRREFPEEALDSEVLQLILDSNRQRPIHYVRDRLIDLTGYDPEVEREKQRLARAAQREAERNAKAASSTVAASSASAATARGATSPALKNQDSSAVFLHTMFPRVKPASISEALQEANGDIELALEKLLCLYAIKDDDLPESDDSSTASTATDLEDDDDVDEDEESEEDDFQEFEEYYEEDPRAAIERLPPAHPISGRRKRKTQEDEEDEDPLDMKAKLQILKDLFPNHPEKVHLSSLLASNQLLSEAVDRLVQLDHPNTYHARLKSSGTYPEAQQQQQQQQKPSRGKRAGMTKITLSLGEYMAQDEDWEPAPSDAPVKVGYELDMASKLKLGQLIALFPSVSDQIVHDVFVQHDLNVEQTTKALHMMGAESKSLQHVHVAPVAAAGNGAQSGPKVVQGHSSSSTYAKAAVSNKPAPAQQAQAVTVVGSAAAAAEPSARAFAAGVGGGASIQGMIKNAAELAELRNWFFRQAARCYQLGHGALARHFSEQGREVGQQMASAHVLAARQSFFEQNNQIDLHGLNVKPAIALLEELLDLHEQKQRSAVFTGEQAAKKLQVITGAGNHSTGRRARIKPAVIKLLKERGYRFTEANSGALDVFLK